MATYKVIQDVEAEDKILGPFSLWQFIYALAAGFCAYLTVIAVMKNLWPIMILSVPIGLFASFLAVPWSKEQSTDVWALAKFRFYMVPRKRIWDQSGVKDLVTITAPKTLPKNLTKNLSEAEVHNRLTTLASTLDSRGWAVKNVNLNMTTQPAAANTDSDRLVNMSNAGASTQGLAALANDITPQDDVMDEMHNPVAQSFDAMIDEAAEKYRKTLIERMNQPNQPATSATPPTVPAAVPATPYTDSSALPAATMPFAPQPLTAQPVPSTVPMPASGSPSWFMTTPGTTTTPPPADNAAAPPITQGQPSYQPLSYASDNTAGVPQAGDPTPEEEALIAQAVQDNQITEHAAYGNMRTLKTPQQLEDEAREQAAIVAADETRRSEEERRMAEMTSEKQAAIMNLARSNDLNIATLAHEMKKVEENEDGEVVISLH